jgi:hypothetical protein
MYNIAPSHQLLMISVLAIVECMTSICGRIPIRVAQPPTSLNLCQVGTTDGSRQRMVATDEGYHRTILDDVVF